MTLKYCFRGELDDLSTDLRQTITATTLFVAISRKRAHPKPVLKWKATTAWNEVDAHTLADRTTFERPRRYRKSLAGRTWIHPRSNTFHRSVCTVPVDKTKCVVAHADRKATRQNKRKASECIFNWNTWPKSLQRRQTSQVFFGKEGIDPRWLSLSITSVASCFMKLQLCSRLRLKET